MTVLEALFPRQAGNDYRGGRLPLYLFGLLTLVMAGRSLVHFLKDDSGVHSIATIVRFAGTPDPNVVVYMYSALWGTQQVVTVLIWCVVLWRYRNLVPLMYGLFALEVVLRMVVGTLHPLTEEHFLRRPPGAVGNLPMLAVGAGMLALALRNTVSHARREAAA
ncbi:MAG: hypothetical protein ACQGVC_22405 [Myxococcota bacterium]